MRSKKLLFIMILLLFNLGYGQNNRTGITSTDWEDGTNWRLGHKSTRIENSTISNTVNQSVISDEGAVCNILIISNTSSGTVSLTIQATTLSVTSISINDTGNNNNNISSINIDTGTVNIIGNITMTGTAVRNNVTFSAAGTINIGDTITRETLNTDSELINYNNAAAKIVESYTYNNGTLSGEGVNLILIGSGTKSIPANVIVHNILSMEGTAISNVPPV
jgi:hypothetical protein